jgi:hypothetical protein
MSPDFDGKNYPGDYWSYVFRDAVWGTGNDDEAIDDDSGADKNVDISNVVWGWELSDNGWGHIKEDGDANDDYIYTVACWQESTGVGEGDIWFSVLWRDGENGDLNVGTAKQVDTGYDDALQRWPSVTAHLGEYENEPRIIVDIAYELSTSTTDNWKIRHCRYAMADYGSDNDFNSFDTLITETVSTDNLHDCIHPDIVFDWAFDDYENPNAKNRLHIVYEVDDEIGAQDIYYRFGEEDDIDDIDWDSPYQINTDGEQDERPRIDVGEDDSTYIMTDQGQQGASRYYVGVVWTHADYVELVEDWYTNIHFCMLPPDGTVPTTIQVRLITDNGNVDYVNGYPYIDIEPVDCSYPKTTFITWTYAEERGPDFIKLEIWGVNTLRLKHITPPAYVTVVDSGDVSTRNGLPTAALEQTDDKDGYLTWLNDEWTPESTTVEVEVYAGDLSWDTSGFYNIDCTNEVNISYGESSWAIDQGYTYGPEIAIFHDDIGMCIWTDIENGTPPSIWGDSSDA